MLRLTVSQPGREARQITFHGDQVTVGRSTENQLVLEDDAVSGRHGRFERRGRHLVYCDVGSTNGSIVHRGGKALVLTGRQVPRPDSGRGRLDQDGFRDGAGRVK
jgi:hypothetical protein